MESGSSDDEYPALMTEEEQWAYACACLQIVCVKCNKYAKDQSGISDQRIKQETNIFVDSITQEKWIECSSCRKLYHLSCATYLSAEMLELVDDFHCSNVTCLKQDK